MHKKKMTEKKSRGVRRGSMDLSGFLERKPAKNFLKGRREKPALPAHSLFRPYSLCIAAADTTHCFPNLHTSMPFFSLP